MLNEIRKMFVSSMSWEGFWKGIWQRLIEILKIIRTTEKESRSSVFSLKEMKLLTKKN